MIYRAVIRQGDKIEAECELLIFFSHFDREGRAKSIVLSLSLQSTEASEDFNKMVQHITT